jgi:hypothetical protein
VTGTDIALASATAASIINRDPSVDNVGCVADTTLTSADKVAS